MKFITYTSLLLPSLLPPQVTPVDIIEDQSCKGRFHQCQYRLECLGPMTDIQHPDDHDPHDIQFVCVKYDECNSVGPGAPTYYPELATQIGIVNTTFDRSGAHCRRSRSFGANGEPCDRAAQCDP